jgi:hypothetical protein
MKLYLATLNSGYLRREFTWFVLPSMRQTKGVTLVWENPGQTWANPISSNRNLITQRFLASDCDFLLMIDDDVVPLHNPAELCHANLPIIGFPAKVRSTGQTIVWTMYTPHVSGEGYSAIDPANIDDMMDLMKVSIVGTGCILVRRDVLENLKAPFHSEFDENGVQVYGTDFAFCRKATGAGFDVYTAPHRICEHYKTLGLNDIDGWDAIKSFDNSNTPYKIPWGGWAITQKDWVFIQGIIKEVAPKRILEFGCGLSSLLMSEKCQVVSYETKPEYIVKVHEKIDGNDLILREWDGKNFITTWKEGPYDLAFVDGPPGENTGDIGRDASIKAASQLCDHILIHDAGRRAEQHHIRTHLRGKFRRVKWNGDHVTRCEYWVRREKKITNEDIRAGRV